MLTRRRLLTLAAAAGATAVVPARAAVRMTEDGLHTQDWFLESLLVLSDDIQETAGRGKRLVVTFELRGCPACREMHHVHLADPAITAFIRSRFEVLQLDVRGTKEVVDLDGKPTTEARLAATYGLRGTPSFLFFKESAEGLGALPPPRRVDLAFQGLLPPSGFLGMFRYVAEKAYERGPLRDYLAAQG